MKIIDTAKETVSNAASAVSGAMRVAIVACVLSVLAVLVALSVALGRLGPAHVSRETAHG